MKIERNVVRGFKWTDGDFKATLENGEIRNTTYEEHAVHNTKVMKIEEIIEEIIRVRNKVGMKPKLVIYVQYDFWRDCLAELYLNNVDLTHGFITEAERGKIYGYPFHIINGDEAHSDYKVYCDE